MISGKNSTGFTLIEMLVSIVIVAIIVASVYTAFECGQNAWRVGDIIVQRCQNARGVLDIMTREICSTIHIASSTYVTGFLYNNDKLRFTVPISGQSSGIWDLCEIWYKYDSASGEIRRYIYDGQDGHLSASLDTLSGSGPSATYDTVVDNITLFAFEFWDNSFTEHTTWNTSSTLPRAVKIMIGVQDDKALEPPKKFTTVVYLSRSR